MCHDTDGRPPIPPIAGGALDARTVTLTAPDGTRFSAFHARAAARTGAAARSGAGVLILPDVRGLHPYYEDLALRFAEHGADALAIDYFGRTAGTGGRDTGFEFMPHVEQATFEHLSADMEAAAAWLRSEEGGAVERLYVVGFCFGGRLAFVANAMGLDLAGAIGFYGKPVGEGRAGVPAPVERAGRMTAPVLGLFGGADAGISASDVAAFEAALAAADVPHRLVTYPDAPHSFFDRKADEFVETSAKAWSEVLDFIGLGAAAPA